MDRRLSEAVREAIPHLERALSDPFNGAAIVLAKARIEILKAWLEPPCPKCHEYDRVILGDLSYECQRCGTSFIPDMPRR